MIRIFCIIGIALNLGLSNSVAAPPVGYSLRYNINFAGQGGTANGWLPILEWGPLAPYTLGTEAWSPVAIAHLPDHRDFGYALFGLSASWQGYGRLNWSPWNSNATYTGQWHGGCLATVDPNGNGFSVTPPFYATCFMTLPAKGRDVWPSFWMTTINRLQSNQSTNSGEIDVIEMYGNAPYTQEIHVNTRDHWGNDLTSSPNFAYNPGALNPYGQFYSVWVDSNNGVIRFYVESGTWDGKPAGDIHEVFSCAYVPDGMNQPWYLLVDYAMQDRSWTGQPWTVPTPMWVKSLQCWKP